MFNWHDVTILTHTTIVQISDTHGIFYKKKYIYFSFKNFLWISFFISSTYFLSLSLGVDTAHFLWKDLNGKVRSSLRPVNTKQSKKERKDALNSQGKERNTKLEETHRVTFALKRCIEWIECAIEIKAMRLKIDSCLSHLSYNQF